MDICLATPEFPPVFSGGIATYYRHLAPTLADAGHRVTVLTPVAADQDQPWEYPGIRVIRLSEEVERRRARLETRLGHHLANVSAIGLEMRHWLESQREPPAVVESVDFGGMAPFLIASQLPALLVTCHGAVGQVTFHEGRLPTPRHERISALELLGIALADELSCYSPLNQEDWSRFLGRRPRLVRTAFRRSARRPAEPASPPGAGAAVRGVVVGRLNNWKGVFEVAEALRLCKSRGLSVEVEWIGRDQGAPEEGVESVRSFLQEHYDDIWGTSLRWRHELPPCEVRCIQAQADFSLVASRWDTFNFTALESMSVGTPPIVSTTAGSSYLCQDGVNGLLIPPRDPAALADAISVLSDPETRTRLGAEALRTVTREFSPERVVSERLDAYEAATDRHRYRQKHDYLPAGPLPLLRSQLTQAHPITTLVAGRLKSLRRRLLPRR